MSLGSLRSKPCIDMFQCQMSETVIFILLILTIILGRAKGLGREQKDLEEKK